MAIGIESVTNAVIIGTLLAIVWSLRILVLLERRVKRMDENLYRIVMKIENEEMRIEKEEKIIQGEIDYLDRHSGKKTAKSKPLKKR